MDALIHAAAAELLAKGDPLGALKRVALMTTAPAFALRGLALAQIGDLARAQVLLKQAIKAFGADHPVLRARCMVAQAEIALVSRDLGAVPGSLSDAQSVLEDAGDLANAMHARQIKARRLLLLGALDGADEVLREIDQRELSPSATAVLNLTRAGIEIRRVRPQPARAALARAAAAVQMPGVASALAAEVAQAVRSFEAPVAILVSHGQSESVSLVQVADLFATEHLIADACRLEMRRGNRRISFASRPVLFALLNVLAEAWPGEAKRLALIGHAFKGREADESHRARLRVEMVRLRAEVSWCAQIQATSGGFKLVLPSGHEAVALKPPTMEENAGVLALLMDGEAWSTSALAIATGSSQRTLQRALELLARSGLVETFGNGPSRRWIARQAVGFPSTLLLPNTHARSYP